MLSAPIWLGFPAGLLISRESISWWLADTSLTTGLDKKASCGHALVRAGVVSSLHEDGRIEVEEEMCTATSQMMRSSS